MLPEKRQKAISYHLTSPHLTSPHLTLPLRVVTIFGKMPVTKAFLEQVFKAFLF